MKIYNESDITKFNAPENIPSSAKVFIMAYDDETDTKWVMDTQSIEEYESNKHYIELGKAVEKAFKNDFTFIKGCYGSCDKELCFEEQLLKWAEGRE